jgi:hypothetical protein
MFGHFRPEQSDARIERDRLHAELRIVADLAQKLSDHANRAAIRLAQLPMVGDATDAADDRSA